ncbi:PBSX family phage terminase large subunit [Clostridium botulinum]|uniref:PBSX family phage terminase large subunit n=1 Tax=Clostridium botulinum TaxID=1491 RepID=A0A6B4JIC7_CLOBO|nr:PBSX family phage terminase large subunit [Clostridium botulinum]EES48171.1 phage terminase, large subunit, pbsx family [Clostridium botulinum E1 str. 'BoNT E Beluga']MBY6760057.1 PBSX family phage terminase large subunit [Clostridium botulinum]MBY6918966.1 PBSX family phage terminase large subunit [Clostridium botulinum]MCR1132613.1 PBSX family phage terminase large subunit [Clostridium botulinum]NFH70478.1 PBSX family phage terminase large subunit [Clostridium botulinum]
MIKVKLKSIIASSFYAAHKDIKQGLHTHHWFKGGRGSTKSSFISIEIVLGIMKDAQEGIMSNALILRRVKDTLSESVRDQIKWAIDILGVSDDWIIPEAKLTITYKSTGQVIRFKGADNPKKVKSTKVPKGYIKYIWYEEVDEFEGYDKIRNINQSLMRGGPKFFVFYSFNPPESQRNWANLEVLDKREDKLIHHSTYLTVPRDWLGEPFITEAEDLKEKNTTKYEHDYLGKVTGTGAEIFDNVVIRKISDEEVRSFDRLYRGVDFGWFPDPWTYNNMYYKANTKELYIFDEAHENKKSNKQTYDIMVKKHGVKPNHKVTCDSAENKSIADYKTYGLYARGAIKGQGSVEYSMKWLQSLNAIIIDNVRCPKTAKEFLEYEHDKDKEGKVIDGYPDRDNHHIDAVRYAMNDVWRRRGQ